MKSKVFPIVVLLVLGFTTCDHALGPMPERQFVYYNVYANPFEHGTVKVEPTVAKPGTSVFVEVNPDPGWILPAAGGIIGEGNLGLAFLDNHFDMPATNVFLTITLQPVPAGNHTVTRGPISHGRISPNVMYGQPGSQVSVAVLPDEDYALKAGGLKANGVPVAGPPYTFTIGAGNVTLTAEFEQISEPARLFAEGKKALEAGDYDAAGRFFESAYNKNPQNNEYIFWASLSKLAGLLIDEDVRNNVLRSHLGFSGYPTTLNRFFSDTWLGTYYHGETADFMRMPALSLPDGWGNESVHQDSLRGDTSSTILTYRVDQWACLVRRNPKGYNEFLTDTLDFLFGEKFESIAALADTMDYDTRIPLSAAMIQSLHLEDVLEPGDTLGKVDIDLVFSLFRAGKALVEYLAAYDWETDTSVFPMNALLDFNAVVEQIVDLVNERGSTSGRDMNAAEAILPFRTKLLTLRDSGLLVKARRDFTKAIEGLAKAGDYYFGGGPIPQAIEDIRSDYAWMPAALTSMKTELGKSGGVFYFSGALGAEIKDFFNHWYDYGVSFEMPKGNYVNPADAKYAVNFDKLFAPGQFNLGNIFLTFSRDTPRFYGFNGGNLQNGTAITSKSQISSYSQVGLRLNMKVFKEVFIKGFDEYGDEEWLHTLIPEAIFNREPGKNPERIFNFYFRQ
jgi:tetratricopeptide (TPR) repeat protein